MLDATAPLGYRAHPNRQFARDDFRLLDGVWRVSLNGEPEQDIRVPYAPEAPASGIGERGVIGSCRYTRTFPDVRREGRRTFLAFGAVDHDAEVHVNGRCVGTHSGGYTPFSFDVTDFMRAEENELTVLVRDDTAANGCSGKQSMRPEPHGCYYSRTTGIWQSVILETRPTRHIRHLRITPHAADGTVTLALGVIGAGDAEIRIYYEGKQLTATTVTVDYEGSYTLPLSEKHLWELGNGRLYEVEVQWGEDTVYSYFGLRDVAYRGKRFLLNGRSVFQRLVLDQGYYPAGGYTATRADFERDVRAAMALGFNGARLHQKLFDPAYLEVCDRLGFMVFGEYADWGGSYGDLTILGQFLGEWREAMERDVSHPAIVLWCPLNEAWFDWERDRTRFRDVRFVDAVYAFTKLMDPSRPVIDVSGGFHGHASDVIDFHCYDAPDALRARMEKLRDGVFDFPYVYREAEGIPYRGEPLMLSEFGGVAYQPDPAAAEALQSEQNGAAWGYATQADEAAFLDRYEATVAYLLQLDFLSGFCYTQLYDVEQEQNGLLTYGRVHKLSPAGQRRIRAVNERIARIEQA